MEFVLVQAIPQVMETLINPFVTNGIAYHCHLGEFNFTFRDNGSDVES